MTGRGRYTPGVFSCLALRFSRQRDGQWLLTIYLHSSEVVEFGALGSAIPAEEIYTGVDLPGDSQV